MNIIGVTGNYAGIANVATSVTPGSSYAIFTFPRPPQWPVVWFSRYESPSGYYHYIFGACLGTARGDPSVTVWWNSETPSKTGYSSGGNPSISGNTASMYVYGPVNSYGVQNLWNGDWTCISA